MAKLDAEAKLNFILSQFKGAKWVADWVQSNPDKKEELLNTINSIDQSQLKGLGNSFVHHRTPRNNPINLTHCALIRQNVFKKRVSLNKRAKSLGAWTIKLANGLNCRLKANKDKYDSSFYFYEWTATIRQDKTTVKLDLWIDQIAQLEDKATKNIAYLKRMRPCGILLRIDGNSTRPPAKIYHAILKMLADKTPVEFAPLLASTS
jgi:hypothetical protein